MGMSYRLNEYRQQIKFYKDLYKHYYNSKFNNIYNKPYDNSQQIPKVINYAWFGKGEYPDLLKKCMKTWPKVLKDYEFKLWNEDNFPIEEYPFAKQAYDRKKYAFVADVARLHCIYNYGGIYIDTDCEALKPFDDLLNCGVFMCYESPNLLSTSTLGAKQYHPWVGLMLLWYYGLDFCDDYAEIANTRIMTRIARLHYSIKPNGKYLELPNDVKIFAREWFCPDKINDEWQTTKDTYVIHHFSGLW